MILFIDSTINPFNCVISFYIVYPQISAALNKTGRPIVFSCSWPAYQVDAGMKVMTFYLY